MQAVIQLARSAGAFFSGTLLSRLSGFGRDLIMAICFGASPAVAAFMVAFRFANLARRLLGEAPLASSFIPHYEALRIVAPEKALRFFADFMLSLSLVLLLLIVPTMLLLPKSPVCDLTRLMLPGLFFICLFGLSTAFLHCEKRFFLPSIAPMAFNIVWIVAIFLLRDRPAVTAMKLLSISVVFAFALQWTISFIPILRKLSWSLIKNARPFSPAVRNIFTPFALGILGVGASQINNALDALFARAACAEGPAYLWYAIRMQQLPLVLFGMAWSTALLPALTKATSDEKTTLLQYAIDKCALFLIPVTFALLPCASAGVNLLFHHGSFSALATTQTTHCLWAYGIGLFPSALVMILAAHFYAQKDFKTPSLAAFTSVLVNITLNALLVYAFHLGAASIALATSLSQIGNAYLLLSRTPIKLRLKKILLASALAALIAALFYPDSLLLATDYPQAILKQLTNLALPFLAFCIFLGLQYRKPIMKLLKK